MQRVLIVGNGGAGKSTLARALGARTGLPVIHLDVLFWKPGWVETGDDEFREAVTEALAAPAWICDGNFGSTWDVRMPRADTIIWIDRPPWFSLLRAIRRMIQYRKGGRPDIAEGCDESIDLNFYRFILTYDAKVKPRLEAALATHGAQARQVRLRSDRDIAAFLEEVAWRSADEDPPVGEAR
jgi:adenylate kinase family enzyme